MNDRLKEENTALQEQNKDYALFRKVFGSRQINELVERASQEQQAKRRPRQRSYDFPCRTVPPEEKRPIGVWGQRHLRYLRQHRKALYTEMLASGRLNGYLADLNKQAETMCFELVKQMAAREGVTEQLKAHDQMLWIQRMNNIRDI